MKKLFCMFIIFMTMLTCGITLLLPKIDEVQADIAGTDGAQFVLVGYSGNNPASYFTNSKGESTMQNAQAIAADKNYINKNGETVNKYNYITGKNTSLTKAKSSGVCEIYPSSEMQKIISAGQMSFKASCGLLALNNEARSKVDVTIEVVAGGKTYKSLTLSSEKVSSNSSVYEPDWVETELVSLPSDTEKIIYYFENRKETNRINTAKFCIFEPTVFFATNLNECVIQTESQSLKIGQVLKLSATNLIVGQSSNSQYFQYYKKIHKITFEIVEGQSYAKVVDSYLYVNGDAPKGAKIVVRAKCRKSSLSGEYIYSDSITFALDVEQTNIAIEKDFDSPAKFFGEGKYFVGDYATLSFSENDGFEFVGWENNGEIVSSDKIYTFKVENNQQIKAKFTKTIQIQEIIVKSKLYDATTKAEIENVVFDGVENSHDVKVENLVANFVTSSIGEQKTIEFSSIPTLSGSDANLYKLTNYIPTTTATITQRPLEIKANALSKIYGDSDPKLTFLASGLVEGENVSGTLSREQGENAGEYGILEGNLVSQNPNYKINFVGATFVIEKREIKFSDVGVVAKTYDKTKNAQIFATQSNIVLGDDVNATFEANFKDSNVGVNKEVQITNVKILGEDAKNYYSGLTTSVLCGTIMPKTANVVIHDQTFCYGEEIQIDYEATGLIAPDELEGKLEISSNQVGTYIISIGSLKNPNYDIILTAAFVHIIPKDIKIEAKSASKSYGDGDPVLDYEIFGLVEGDELLGNIKREVGENVGIYQIEQGTLHNENYNIEFIPANFDIIARNAYVEFVANDKTYDGTSDVEYSFTLKNTLEKDGIVLQTDLKFEDSNVGDNKNIIINKIEIEGSNKQNYVLKYDENLIMASIFAKKVKITADSLQKTYGDDDPQLNLQFEGVIENEKIYGQLQRFEGEDVGKYNYEITQSMRLQNTNYELSLASDVSLEIKAKKIQVSICSTQKQFGDADPEFEYVCDENEFVFGQTFEGLLIGSATREMGEEIGRYCYMRGSISFGDNYEIEFISSGVLTITKREIEIEADSHSKIYGENDPIFSFSQTNIVPGVSSTIKLKREKGENVGTYKITYDSLDDPHYNINFVSGKLEIIPCEISVKAEDTFKYFSENDPVVEFVLYYGSLQFDEELGDILCGEISREAGEDVGEYMFSQGTLTAGGNYTLTFVPGKLCIYAQELNIKILDATKYYGDSDPVFDYEILSGDKDVVLSGKAKRRYGENVGEYVIEVGTLSTPANYKFKYTCGLLTILPRPIEVTALPVVKIYGENDPEFVYEITSGTLVNPNDLSGGIYRENVGVKIYENVGKYPLLSNLSNPNYEISYVGNELSINQREVVVSTQNVSSIYGEEISTEFDYVLDGEILTGDTLTGGLYKAEGEDAGRYPIRCNINLGRNYKVRYIQAYYDILPRTLVVSLGANQKIYSNPDPCFNLQILQGELVLGEQLEWEVQRDASEDIGEYVLNVVSMDQNYEVHTRNSILVILAKDVKLNVEVLDKTYDGTTTCKIKNPIVSGLVDNEIMLDFDKNACANFASIEPGNDIAVSLQGFSLVGSKAKNYNLIMPTGLYADITYATLENQNVEVSTYSSTAMKYGTVLSVKDLKIGNEYAGKKIVQSMSVGLFDASGNTLVLDKALDMKINLKNLNNLNNIHVFGKNATGDYVELAYKIQGENLLVSTSTFSEFIVVCDNENWIDIAVAVCVGVILGVALCALFISFNKKRKQTKK